MSVNSVSISGNLGRDPELRATASGTSVCSFPVCANSRVKREGKWEDKPNWVEVKFFGNRAEPLSRILSKGSHVCLHGHLSQETWESDGKRRSRLVVIGDEIDFSGQGREDPEPDDDIPF